MSFFENFAANARTLPLFLEKARHDDLEAS
jgi:hypothetical protein